LLLGIGLGAAGVWLYQANWRTVATEELDDGANGAASEPEQPPAKRAVFALGTLQPRDGSVLITSPSVGTLIQAVPVREGQSIEAGEILIELDATLAQQELRLAESQRRQAQGKHAAELLAARQRVDAAGLALNQARTARENDPAAPRKQLDVAQLKADQARSELTRLEGLQRTNPQVAPQVEQQRSLVRLAEAERDAADAALARAEQSLTFAVQKVEAEKRAADEALRQSESTTAIAVLDEQVKLAERKVKECRITAPRAGTIVSLSARPGERVSAQPLMQIADLKVLQCEAEVDVADIPVLQGRREAFLTSHAFRGARVPATLERIGNTVGSATLRPLDPRKAVDRTVTTVVLSVDAAEARRLLGTGASGSGTGTVHMGLQVDVEIPLGR
jgi:ABC exporter DevB family membrane fusion protein